MNKAIVFLLISLSMFGCSSKNSLELYSFRGATMGTTYSVRFVAPKNFDLMSLKKRVDDRLKEINLSMSTYIPISEISKFNKSQANIETTISNDFKKVLEFALFAAKKTDGVFDPTIGPLVNLWGFGPNGQREVPAQARIDQALKSVGYEKLILKSNLLSKTVASVYVDLSASAKGYGVDTVLELVNTKGLNNAMVEIGGEVRTSGRSLKRPWKIGVESPNPVDQSQRVLKVIKVEDFALATSGDYRNFFRDGGKKYSHTIDYRTGEPVQGSLASVSVISNTCLEADTWSTALMAMGAIKGFKFAVENDIKAFFIYRSDDGSGKFIEKATPAFEKVVH